MLWEKLSRSHLRSLKRVTAVSAVASVLAMAPGALVLAASPPPVLYVSPSGRATNSGSRQSPFATIAEAVAAAIPGTTILVEPGTYTMTSPVDIGESLTLTTETGRYWSSRTTITGQGPVFVLQNGSGGVTGVTISGFNFVNITDPTGSANGVITTPGYGAGDIRIVDNRFANIATQAIGDHANPDLPSPLNTGWVIADNLVQNVSVAGQSGIWLGNLQDSWIGNNTVDGTGWAGILATAAGSGTPTANLVIAGNRVSNVPHEGIQVAFGDHVQIRGNTVRDTGLAGYTNPTASMDAAISLFNTDQSQIVVRDNTLVDNYQGVELGQASVPSVLGAVGPGIAVVDNNLVDNVGGGVVNNAAIGFLNAADNWWGSRSGPMAGETIGAVDTVPYLLHPVGVGESGVNGPVV